MTFLHYLNYYLTPALTSLPRLSFVMTAGIIKGTLNYRKRSSLLDDLCVYRFNSFEIPYFSASSFCLPEYQ